MFVWGLPIGKCIRARRRSTGAAPLRVSITFRLCPSAAHYFLSETHVVGSFLFLGHGQILPSSHHNLAETQSSRDPIPLETHHFGFPLILGHRQISTPGHHKIRQRPNIPGDPFFWVSKNIGSLADTLSPQRNPTETQYSQRPIFWVSNNFWSPADTLSPQRNPTGTQYSRRPIVLGLS